MKKLIGIIALLAFSLPLLSATIWRDRNNYTAGGGFGAGDIIVINVRDVSVIQFDLSSQTTDNVSVDSEPDTTITGFLPKVTGSKKIKGDDTGKFGLKEKVGFSIAAQIQNVQGDGKFAVAGTKVYTFNGVANTIAVSGIVDPVMLRGRKIDSVNVAGFQMQISGRRQLMNLEFPPLEADGTAGTELTEQQKQQLIIEYLRKMITEQARP